MLLLDNNRGRLCTWRIDEIHSRDCCSRVGIAVGAVSGECVGLAADASGVCELGRMVADRWGLSDALAMTKPMALEPTEVARADIQQAHLNRLAMLAQAHRGFGE